MRTQGKMQGADGEEDPGALPDGVEGDGWVGQGDGEGLAGWGGEFGGSGGGPDMVSGDVVCTLGVHCPASLLLLLPKVLQEGGSTATGNPLLRSVGCPRSSE